MSEELREMKELLVKQTTEIKNLKQQVKWWRGLYEGGRSLVHSTKMRNDWLEEVVALCVDENGIDIEEEGFPVWEEPPDIM